MKGLLLLIFLCGLVALGKSRVDVDPLVSGNSGQTVNLSCIYTGNYSSAGVIWQKLIGGSRKRIAIANPAGSLIDADTDLYGRLTFTNLDVSDLRDGSIRIEDLRVGDEGTFYCAFTTLDPISAATIILTVNVPPKVSLELNPSQLVEGMGQVTVATCVAENGNPAATVTWRGLNQGDFNETRISESNGTVTVRSRYWLEPTYESHGRTLACRVEHPALEPPVEELSTTPLDIHYKPRVRFTVNGGDWYVGKEGASLTCEADANPNITHYLWSRINDSLPNGTVQSGKTLCFERPLNESDSGSFSCRVNNSVGWGEAVVNITIRKGTTTAATTSSTTTTTVTNSVTTENPDNGVGNGTGGTEPWVIAVAVIVPLLVIAAVVASAIFYRKKRTKATQPRSPSNDGNGPGGHTLEPTAPHDYDTIAADLGPDGAQQHRKPRVTLRTVEENQIEYAEVSISTEQQFANAGPNGRPVLSHVKAPNGALYASADAQHPTPAISDGKQNSTQAKPATIYAELDNAVLHKQPQGSKQVAAQPTAGHSKSHGRNPASSILQAGGQSAYNQQSLQKPKPPIALKPHNSRQAK